ncbi:MAG: hypothetical protein mread185_000335 [Mycoplasmataceae bacterium]|nr:MAG: hypothetical protein mread185_000335 [Mycoplasmataceae bacterium]
MPKTTNQKPSPQTTQAPIPNFDTVDGRYLNRTNRTVHFATKVTPEFNRNIRRLAHEQSCLITEMLEKFMSAYFELEELKQVKKLKKKEQFTVNFVQRNRKKSPKS